MIAISTVRDRAAAEVAREALAAVGIPVEVRRLGGDVYFGSATTEEFEIRVAPEDFEAAQAELDRLEEEMEVAVYAAAGVPPDDEPDEPDQSEVERPKKISWALALSALLPFPGAGCMYAGSTAAGLVLLGACAGLVVFGAHVPWGLQGFAALKLADLALAPLFVIRNNRRLQDASHS